MHSADGVGSLRWGLWVVIALSLLACREREPAPASFEPRIPPQRVSSSEDPFEPIPETIPTDPRKVELGRRLFDDPRLSGDGKRRCSDCHDLNAGGVSPGEARSNHPVNPTGPYNVPTVYNVAFNFRYNWNGKFTQLEDHVGGLMMSPLVMNAGSWAELIERIKPAYDEDFKAAGYAEGASEAGVRETLAEYQRSLITPNAKFDRFLTGKTKLSALEKRGYDLFKDVGCSSCHQGINVGGNLFQRYGVMADAFGGRELSERDYGRMLLTGRQEDAHVFRVPSLRNVAITAPYFHDGSAKTLDEAVVHMGLVQLGTTLSPDEVSAIVAFLHTLTGEIDGKPLARSAPDRP